MASCKKEGYTKQGVRDLASPYWKNRPYEATIPRVPRDPVLPVPPVEKRKTVTGDLIYFCLPKEDRDRILGLWPEARFEDLYDDIHETRTGVILPDVPEKEWLKFVISNGLGEVSFGAQMTLLRNPDVIREVLNELPLPGERDDGIG